MSHFSAHRRRHLVDRTKYEKPSDTVQGYACYDTEIVLDRQHT